MIKKRFIKYWILTVALQALAITWVMAQNTLQVVTRTVTREIPYKPGDSLLVEAEKATVQISAWEKDYISLTLRLISKHNKLEVAKEELGFLQFKIGKTGVTHQLKNYFKSDVGFKKVKGILLSEYELKVPGNLLVTLKSQYGRANITGLESPVKVDTRFVELELIECKASQEVLAYFGNVNMVSTEGVATIDLQRSDFSLTSHAGKATINSSYGKVKIRSQELTGLEMKGNKTAVEIFANDLKSYHFNLSALYDRVFTPLGILRGIDDSRFQTENAGKAPTIRIETTYRPIELNLQNNVADN